MVFHGPGGDINCYFRKALNLTALLKLHLESSNSKSMKKIKKRQDILNLLVKPGLF